MKTEARIKDHPHLRRRGAGVVDVDKGAYEAALARLGQAKRFSDLEKATQSLEERLSETNYKLDYLIELIKARNT